MSVASKSYDVIVAGLGAMGSMTVQQLASRGHRVLGLERFHSPHAFGSSHGQTRIIREAYFEDPLYVPLVQRAYACWTALEQLSGAQLFTRTGGLMIGSPDGELTVGARRSAQAHALQHDVVSGDALHARFPAFLPDVNMIGVWEPNAGILAPERAISAALGVAAASGADVRMNEPLQSWHATPSGVTVRTALGDYHAQHLVLTLGPWIAESLPELQLPVQVQRNVLYWFTPLRNREQFAPARFPIFLCEYTAGQSLYGFPDTGDGVKLALHHHGEYTQPDALRREVTSEEVDVIRGLMARYLPDANGVLRQTAACMYTNTPDGHFIIDAHPAHENVTIASPCSGHGFKFASAIGEVLADRAVGRRPAFDLHPFRLSRFTP